MGFPPNLSISPLLLLLIFPTFCCSSPQPDEVEALVTDHAFRCYADQPAPRTAVLYSVPLPAGLPSVRAHTARYRSGSLRRYGARVREFHIAPGTGFRPRAERVVLVREIWALPWSATLFNTSGHRLLSPVLGLLAYDSDSLGSDSPSRLEILAEKQPLSIDFSDVFSSRPHPPGPSRLLCAHFDANWTMSVYDPSMAALKVCDGFGGGHYALVMEEEEDIPGDDGDGDGGFGRKWKVVMGCSVVGGVVAVVLLGLLCVAVVESRKRREMAEMERKAYEEEALQMALVGHFVAPTAGATRTTPALEMDFKPVL